MLLLLLHASESDEYVEGYKTFPLPGGPGLQGISMAIRGPVFKKS